MKSLTTLESRKHGNPLFPLATYSVKFPPGSEILDLHWHSELEFLVVTKGVGIFFINDVEYRVKTGDLLVINGGSLHRGYTADGLACNFIAVVFNTTLLARESEDLLYNKYYYPVLQYLKSSHPVLLAERYGKLITKITDLHKINQKNGSTRELDLKITLMQIFKELYFISRDDELTHNHSTSKFLFIKAAIEFIHTYYNHEIRVSDISTKAGLSEAHFSRVFKTVVGKTVMDYVNDFRINIAMDILKNSDQNITLIAERVGFESTSYFIKKFREYTGLTPGKYRKG